MKDSVFKRMLLPAYRFVWSLYHYAVTGKIDYWLPYLPVSGNKIVFDNFFGRAYGENPKYIAEEIHRQGLPWDMVWLVKDDTMVLPPYLRKVRYGSDEAKRELATARVLISNVRNDMRVQKKKGQIHVQTWHGGIGFKDVEGAAESKLDPGYVECAKRDGAECDVIISACAYETAEYQKHFWLDPQTEILEAGQPRCDALFTDDQAQTGKQVRSTLRIPDDRGIILYAPTFRDDGSLDGCALDFDSILDAFEKRFRRKFVMIVRLHPNAQTKCAFLSYNDRIIAGSSYPDIQELYIASDVLITDYSSAAFDFALLRKPVFLCALDYDRYVELRGLNEVYAKCPFVKAYSNPELLQAILDFSEEAYMERFEAFEKQYWQPFDDGRASERVVAWLRARIG